MYKIMIVEDDKTIADILGRHLKKWGYLVHRVTDFDTVLQQFSEVKPHAILLDIALPFFDGYHWCREIRRRSQVPIIFISSAAEDMNLVMAIHMGGDDFVAKPFSLEVVTAKLQALLRRTYSFGSEPNILEHGGITLNRDNGVLSFGEESLELTKNEFKIMELLLEKKGMVVSRDKIIGKLWEDESFIDDNTLTVNMTRLRKKLSGMGLEDLIVTKKGMGYLIEG
ncbi:MAG: response regulator transcription factor [Eubacterium sp.]